jgi:hypothetical protein
MKTNRICTLFFLVVASLGYAQTIKNNQNTTDMDYQIHKIESRVNGLSLAITHKEPDVALAKYPILLLHGATFPAALSFGYG